MYENKGQTYFYLSLNNMFLHRSFMKTALIREYIDHSCYSAFQKLHKIFHLANDSLSSLISVPFTMPLKISFYFILKIFTYRKLLREAHIDVESRMDKRMRRLFPYENVLRQADLAMSPRFQVIQNRFDLLTLLFSECRKMRCYCRCWLLKRLEKNAVI